MGLKPWDTVLVPSPGMTIREMEAECEKLWHRQKVIYGFLDGEVDEDYLGDYLAQDNIDPYAWLAESIQNFEDIHGTL